MFLIREQLLLSFLSFFVFCLLVFTAYIPILQSIHTIHIKQFFIFLVPCVFKISFKNLMFLFWFFFFSYSFDLINFFFQNSLCKKIKNLLKLNILSYFSKRTKWLTFFPLYILFFSFSFYENECLFSYLFFSNNVIRFLLLTLELFI